MGAMASMNPTTAWLVRRAALAIALMVGFYVMALAIGLGLLSIPVVAIAKNIRIPAKLLLIPAGAGLTVLWAIVPRPDRFTAPGPRLDEASHPDLFRMIRDVAMATKQDLPSDVYLLNEVNAWVAHRGGVMGFGSHRVMGVGLPLLQALSQLELKAIIAHEFGHYASGDVRIGPWIYKTRAAIGRTLQDLRGGWLEEPFKWYGEHFLRLTHDISRQQEFMADRIAAGVSGAAAMSSALRRVTALAPTFSSYLSNEVAPVLRAGFLPPITGGFDDFRRDERFLSLAQKTIEDGREAQVARRERDLGLGDDAAGAGDRFLRAEGTYGSSQEGLRPDQVAELRHGDASQRQRRRIISECDACQRAKRVSGGQRPRRGRDYGVHVPPGDVFPGIPLHARPRWSLADRSVTNSRHTCHSHSVRSWR
jgi:Zn-dependent protease with chaperone function